MVHCKSRHDARHGFWGWGDFVLLAFIQFASATRELSLRGSGNEWPLRYRRHEGQLKRTLVSGFSDALAESKDRSAGSCL